LAISFKVDASRNLKERVVRRCGSTMASRFDSYTFHAFAKHLIDRFRQVLTGIDSLDPDYSIEDQRAPRMAITFKDLVPLAIEILKKSPLARNSLRATYSDIFLDEFQDCTAEQYELVKLAFLGTHTRLTAVGDTKQKIMGWAGALDGIFQVLANDFHAQPLNMYMNFRSDPVLRRMQNTMVRRMDPQAAMPEEEIVGSQGHVHTATFQTVEEEANYTTDLIQSWIINEGIPASSIAILVSKQPHLFCHNVFAGLSAAGISTRNEQDSQDFCSEPITVLLNSFLLCVCSDGENEAWASVQELANGIENFRHNDRWLDGLARDCRSSLSDGITASLVDECVRSLLSRAGRDQLASLSPSYQSGHRMDELIADYTNQLAQSCGSSAQLVQFLRTLGKVEAVRVLSIHKSKGLEFDRVIIMGVEAETFFGSADDERCAFFVGISRAKHHLVLTSCSHRPLPPTATARERTYWRPHRSPHQEFLAYAAPFVT
jgi:superfamily I DNA/RNA helicase